jgi:HEAT repeat protein
VNAKSDSRENRDLTADLPQRGIWGRLLSGNRDQITAAVKDVERAGLGNDYALLLLAARRRNARRTRLIIGPVKINLPYTERERRSALSALGMLWGGTGKDLARALDPKASHFEREHAHLSLMRRRDPRAVRPLVDAMLEGYALEDWRCIATLGALGDLRAVDALLRYVGLDANTDRDVKIALDFGIEVGKALREMNARAALQLVQSQLSASLPRQRAAAALVLAGWGDEKLAEQLMPLIEDVSAPVRRAAISALGELRAAASLLPLQTVLSDPDLQVRIAAERALQQVHEANAQRAIKVCEKFEDLNKRFRTKWLILNDITL